MTGHIATGLLAAGCWLLVSSQWSVVGFQPMLSARSTLPQLSRQDEPLPVTAAPVLPPRAELFVGQGFDTCEIPTLAALQTWFVESPYRAVNLYIGGSGRHCSNKKLNAELVAQLGQIGWKFIPTWVGPQAPCFTGNKPLMSDDPATAHAQGIAEARAAIKTATELGLALSDGSGTIIYYDMEAYASHVPACDDPVRAFISGWTGELHANGNLAGVYGNAHALTGFASLANVPDAVWPARWLHTAYDPAVTVWDVPNLSPALWAEHQRIWQYAGGHNETWGGVRLNIDCNVIDGIVATLSPPVLPQKIYLPAIIHDGGSPQGAVK